MKKLLLLLPLVAMLSVGCSKKEEPQFTEPTKIYTKVFVSQSYGANKMTCKLSISGTNIGKAVINWGDGTAKTAINYGILDDTKEASHIYTEVGTYTIRVEANKGLPSTSEYEYVPDSKEVKFIAEKQIDYTPQASFVTSITGLSVKFNNTSKNATSYLWVFGDGATSDEKSPTHTYAKQGKYEVKLNCYNTAEGKTYSATSIQHVTVSEGKPQASFTTKNAHPLKVVFTNTSVNATSYLWDFGDGTTSTEVNPTHRYSTIGVFKVKLTASNKSAKTDTFEQVVTVEAPTTCVFTGFVINKIPTNNNYYQIQLTDDYMFSKTTYLYTNWFLLSSAILPYEYNFSSPKTLSLSSTYVLRLYKSASKTSGQADGKGTWTSNITSAKLHTYPESVTYYDSSASITVNFLWK